MARDPENRLLARGPRFRLPAEVVRDNALAIARLCWSSGSAARRSSRTSRPACGKSWPAAPAKAPYVQDKGAELYRRSLYVYRKRTVPHPAMATFDAPSREICQVKRPRTNTPLQALELLERRHLRRGRAAAGAARARTRAARRPKSGSPSPSAGRLARMPTPRELRRPAARARALSPGLRDRQSRGAATDPARREPADPRLDPVELAAYTATASVILNLDETITLE